MSSLVGTETGTGDEPKSPLHIDSGGGLQTGAMLALEDWNVSQVNEWIAKNYPVHAGKIKDVKGADLASLNETQFSGILEDRLQGAVLFNALQPLKRRQEISSQNDFDMACSNWIAWGEYMCTTNKLDKTKFVVKKYRLPNSILFLRP